MTDTSAAARPPDGTRDGTVCWLVMPYVDGPAEWLALIWRPDTDCWSGIFDVSVRRVWRYGWRFHSVAVVPDE